MIRGGIKIVAIIIALLIGTNSSVYASEKAKEHTTTKKAPKSLKDIKISPEAEKAAYHLFKVLKIKEGIRNALDKSLDYQIKRMPAMEPYRDIYIKYFHKYTKWDDMKKDLAKLYAMNFTAKELEELAKFYSTKLGQKSLVILPRLTAITMKLAQKRIASHANELKQEVAKRAKELQKDETK